MTLEKIREVCEQQPFRPFTFHLPDGRSVPVEHPDFISFSKGGRILAVTHRDETESLIDLMLVSDITVQTRAPSRRA